MSKNIVILGGGESGVGAALLAQQKGYTVFVSDFNLIKDKYKEELNKYNIPFEDKQHTTEKILQSNIVVKSPGIPNKAPIIQQIKANNISIVSEIEFAAQYTNATIIAITGSNGKTTTTALIYHILNKAEFDVALAGNIGDSFAKKVWERDYQYFVLEISSFQLDDIQHFKPHIAIITNITEDHLDRYNYDVQNYIDAKFNITKNQTNSDYLIYNIDDPYTINNLNKYNIQSKLIPFSYYKQLEEGGFVNNNELIIQLNKNNFSMSLNELSIQGIHNTYNSLAAGISAKILDVRNEKTRESFQDFKNMDHRLEYVISVRHIDFINDSKATNVNSTWFALESMTKPTVLLLGGVDKGNDYTLIKDLVKEKVKAIICIGEDNETLHQAFSDVVGYIVDSKDMEDAVKLAYNIADKGDVVLLSPCCASFDRFDNYEDRGNQFKKFVRSL
ncbi:MAG: UDP-N-acetylmuramoyl-L-alanine--D-glutamate ligase [Chitinophagales bacterium]|nr:UDP-N-acetylmuramoyl-L-alanine--D-glutamate ligase [Chitinophagales bacterium]